MRMRKAMYDRRGDPAKALYVVEGEIPSLRRGEVLLEVLAAPINPADLLTISGDYGKLPPLPAVGGAEGVGRIVAQGPGVQEPALGSIVLLPFGSGTWATHQVAASEDLLILPPNADPEQLAMLTCNPPAALLMLTEFADLRPGEWVIQNASNSAVGGYLVQLAKARGLKTVNVVRRESAAKSVKALGGDIVLVDGDDLDQRVRYATQEAPIALGIDAVGGTSTERLATCLAENGILVNYGLMSGQPCNISPKHLIFRGICLRGFWRAKWFRDAPPEQRHAVLTELAEFIAEGVLLAEIEATFELDRINEAVAAAKSGERRGKILVLPGKSNGKT